MDCSDLQEFRICFKLTGDNMKHLRLITDDDYLGYVNRLSHACRGIVIPDGKVLLKL